MVPFDVEWCQDHREMFILLILWTLYILKVKKTGSEALLLTLKSLLEGDKDRDYDPVNFERPRRLGWLAVRLDVKDN